MFKLFRTPVVLSMLAVAAIVLPAKAGVSVQVNLGVPVGYIGCNDLDDDMDWDNMIVINNDRVGLWVMLPSGVWVFHCRNMWYNNALDEWQYGPWWYDYTMSYGQPFPGIGFHIYMQRHYPRYHARYFYHNNGHYFWHHHDRYNNRYVHHESYNPPRMKSSETTIRHENRDGARIIERDRTTVITREPSAPVRTDGGNRIDRVNNRDQRTDVVRSHESNRPAQVVRERATTRGQDQGTRVTRTETRRDNRR